MPSIGTSNHTLEACHADASAGVETSESGSISSKSAYESAYEQRAPSQKLLFGLIWQNYASLPTQGIVRILRGITTQSTPPGLLARSAQAEFHPNTIRLHGQNNSAQLENPRSPVVERTQTAADLK